MKSTSFELAFLIHQETGMGGVMCHTSTFTHDDFSFWTRILRSYQLEYFEGMKTSFKHSKQKKKPSTKGKERNERKSSLTLHVVHETSPTVRKRYIIFNVKIKIMTIYLRRNETKSIYVWGVRVADAVAAAEVNVRHSCLCVRGNWLSRTNELSYIRYAFRALTATQRGTLGTPREMNDVGHKIKQKLRRSFFVRWTGQADWVREIQPLFYHPPTGIGCMAW